MFLVSFGSKGPTKKNYPHPPVKQGKLLLPILCGFFPRKRACVFKFSISKTLAKIQAKGWTGWTISVTENPSNLELSLILTCHQAPLQLCCLNKSPPQPHLRLPKWVSSCRLFWKSWNSSRILSRVACRSLRCGRRLPARFPGATQG